MWAAKRVEIKAPILVILTVSHAGVPIMRLNGESRINDLVVQCNLGKA